MGGTEAQKRKGNSWQNGNWIRRCKLKDCTNSLKTESLIQTSIHENYSRGRGKYFRQRKNSIFELTTGEFKSIILSYFSAFTWIFFPLPILWPYLVLRAFSCLRALSPLFLQALLTPTISYLSSQSLLPAPRTSVLPGNHHKHQFSGTTHPRPESETAEGGPSNLL